MGIIRKTKPVKEILHLFENKEEAISVVQLIELMHTKMNRTTVYRILERLEQDGILHSFNGKDGLKWYAKCQGCNHTVDFFLVGQCADCQS